MPESARSRWGIAYPVPADGGKSGPAAAGQGWPQRLAGLGVVLCFLIPGSLLNRFGIPYSDPGGSYLVKFHPSSYLIVLALLIALANERDRAALARLPGECPAVIVYIGVLGLVMAYTAYHFGPGGAGFYIDTLLMPGLLTVLLLTGAERSQRIIFHWILGLSVLNSLIGLLESGLQWHLIPYTIEGKPVSEEYFRSAALSNHPLESAQRTVAIVLTAFVLPMGWRALVIPVLLLSLLAFGSRSALVLAVVFPLIWLAIVFVKSLYTRHLNIGWLVFASILAMGLGGVTLYLANWLELGGRIFETFYWDESAASRIESLRIIADLSVDQLLLGIGQDGVQALVNAQGHWFNIENFWVVLLLQLGVVMFAPLTAALLWLCVALAGRGPTAVHASVLAYLIAASSNDALSHKTPNLTILVAAWIGAAAVARHAVGRESVTLDRFADCHARLRALSRRTLPDPDVT